MRRFGRLPAFFPASRRLIASCGVVVGVTLYAIGSRASNRHRASFALDTHAAVQASGMHDRRLLPVLVLHDSKCLEFMWFARQVRLRLSHHDFASPVAVLLFDSPFPIRRTRDAAREARAQGFPVLVMQSAGRLLSSREVTPSLIITDGNGRLRAAVSVPSTADDMYRAIRAIAALGLSPQ
ncbi:MAG: hypothetical protein IT359_19770 [Gemmatimonadaceae bacterium]|nr:hypothetical protein [Gemmatimonadaceae bacterium]